MGGYYREGVLIPGSPACCGGVRRWRATPHRRTSVLGAHRGTAADAALPDGDPARQPVFEGEAP